jgi:hypothetical protein
MCLMDNKLGLQNMKVKSYFLRSILPPAVKDESPCIMLKKSHSMSGYSVSKTILFDVSFVKIG